MGIVTPQQNITELAAQIARRQQEGERAVFTNGVFDLLHLGHIQYLQRAYTLGDLLIVGVNSDASTRALKGPRRPLVPEMERAETLAALAMIDYVTIFDEPTAGPLIEMLRPAVYVKGADYAPGALNQPDAGAHEYLITPARLRRLLGLEPADADDSAGSEDAALADLAARLPEAPVVASYGGSLALLAYLPGHSTSALIARIVERYGTMPNDQTHQAF
ncbi:MAG TPA: adenylyltransferase/cytidyltransferase family protein [Ktedonobacterales bacterium]|nr:adenylyltransferase/cytidyltransferase family protein [Ktedonobacterales bacterium]